MSRHGISVSLGITFFYGTYTELFAILKKLHPNQYDLTKIMEDTILPMENALDIISFFNEMADVLVNEKEPGFSNSENVAPNKNRIKGKYTASLRSGSYGGSYYVQFRHPLLKDSKGKVGKKIRKGLGSDETYAKEVVVELNDLLSNPELWTKESRDYLLQSPSRAAQIFYSNVEFAEEGLATNE